MGDPEAGRDARDRTVAVRCRTRRATDAALAAGRLAYERHAWGEAFESLSAADAAGDLDAEDLERLAIAAYLHRASRASRRRSARAPTSRPSETGDVELAIRVAISLGMALIQRGEMAQAGGWLARGGAAHRGDRLRRRRAWAAPRSREALRALMSGDPATAFAIFEQVAAIADRFGDRDLADDRPARSRAVADRDGRGPTRRRLSSTRR